nr:hypothetical protein [Tanacetum cinerariifolium]
MALNNAQTKTNSLAFSCAYRGVTGSFETALPPAPAAGADAQALADWVVLFYRHNEVACLMLGTNYPKLYQVYDTGCGTHICNTKHGLRGAKKLNRGSLYLYVGNGNISPVAEIRAIRILIAIAAYYDYEIWQMDVKTMFLNGFLEEEIYIEQPKGEAAFILGIKIYRDRSRRLIELSQNEYLDKILKIYRMDNSKRGSIPMQVDLHLSKSQCATTSAEMKRMHNVSYASANSGEAHWTDVKNILKYLRNTKDTFLVYGGDPEAELRVNCYCDAGFETDRDDTESQTGYVFVLNGGAVYGKAPNKVLLHIMPHKLNI